VIKVQLDCSSTTSSSSVQNNLQIMEQRTNLFFLLLILTVNYSYEQQQQKQNCIPLKQCTSLLLLLRNRDDLPNLTRVDVYRHLQRVHCGFQGNDPLVECPDIEGKIPIVENLPILEKKSSDFELQKQFTRF
jgi:hypothetical protein